MVKALPALLVALLAGCSADAGRVLHVDPDPRGSGAPVFFPGPPEVPRYFYAGQLVGEGNYLDPQARTRGGLRDALAWIAGLDAAPEVPEGLSRPQAGTMDAAGRVYVTDASRQAVVVFNPERGVDTWTHAEGSLQFRMPVGVAVGAQGRVYVADADLALVARIEPGGKTLAAIGRGLLRRPTGLAFDAEGGRLFVIDSHAHDIKVLDGEGRLLATFGRRGEGPGEFNFPTHCFYARGELYVADTMNGRVQVLSAADGSWRRTIGARGLNVGNLVRPKGVAVDGEGNVYVVESYHDHLLVYDRDGRFLLPIGGLGQDAGQFYLPAGAWTDDRNRIFVADMFNGRVVVLQFLGGDGAR